MKRFVVWGLLPASLSLLYFVGSAGARNSTNVLKQRERNTVSLELEFTKKNANSLQRLVSMLTGVNGYATGFLVSDRTVVTAFHVISGDLDPSKKLALGFGRDDELEARAFIGGCQAKVVGVDKDADLALLEICGSRQAESPTFQSNVSKDEKLLLIARPHGDKIISYGTFNGAYSFRGLEYWSAKLSARDGFSGSPVYNEQGELVGVFSGDDWSQKLAVISPGDRAQKLVAQYSATAGP
jgi:S1-C subfamily serine protease